MKRVMNFLFGNMEGLWGATKLVGGGVVTFIISALGGWDMALQVLIFFTCIDIITGILSAIYDGKANSAIGYRGIIRKIGIYAMVSIAVAMDSFLNTDPTLRTAIIGFYIAMEGLSILENWGKMDLPIPDFVKKALEQLKSKNEQGTEDENIKG